MRRETTGNRLMEQVVKLIDELVGIDLNLSDEPGALSVAAMTAPMITEMMSRAEGLFEELNGFYQGEAMAPGPQKPYRPARSPELTQTMAGEITDLVHLSRGEIASCRQRLENIVANGNPLRVVATCGEAQRRLSNALLHIEEALAAFEGLKVPARVLWDLEISLAIRRRYAELRQELELDQRPEPSELRDRLVKFADRFADLKASSTYRFLRFEDRIHLATLLKRTKQWLQDSSGEATTEVGLMLWDELQNLVELLRLVSNRHELREHDEQVLEATCRELYDAGSPPESMPEHLCQELESLLGLDRELDQLIRNVETHPPAEWEPCLRRLVESRGLAVMQLPE